MHADGLRYAAVLPSPLCLPHDATAAFCRFAAAMFSRCLSAFSLMPLPRQY